MKNTTKENINNNINSNKNDTHCRGTVHRARIENGTNVKYISALKNARTTVGAGLASARGYRGITLIALIITIIVLLILAGVALNFIVGQNGILTHSETSKQQYELASAREELEMVIADIQTEIIKTEGRKATLVDLENRIDKNKYSIILSTDPIATTTEVSTNYTYATVVELEKEIEFTVDDKLIIRNVKLSDFSKLGYDNPYIPEGYRYKEGTWNNGYTIIEKTTNNTIDPNDETKLNTFVWIPCVINNEQIKKGDFVTIFKKVDSYNSQGFTIVESIYPTEEIRKSVEKYGGFYIAKYEAGIEGTVDNYNKSIKTEITEKPLSQLGKGVWNYISRTDASTVASNMVNTSNGVKSGLITGECWDTILQWIVNTSDKSIENKNFDINSAGKGWHLNVSENKIHTTGAFSINNIYDLAGNVWEWTTETNTSAYPITNRGGSYDLSGTSFPASYYGNDLDAGSHRVGFRVVLYMSK